MKPQNVPKITILNDVPESTLPFIETTETPEPVEPEKPNFLTELSADSDVNSLFHNLLGKLQEAQNAPKTTPPPRIPAWKDDEPCVKISKLEETSGAFVHTSWINGGRNGLNWSFL